MFSLGKKKAKKGRKYESLLGANDTGTSHEPWVDSSYEAGFGNADDREVGNNRERGQYRAPHSTHLQAILEDVASLMRVSGFKIPAEPSVESSSAGEEGMKILRMLEDISMGTEVNLCNTGRLHDDDAESLRRHYTLQLREAQEITSRHNMYGKGGMIELKRMSKIENEQLRMAALEASKALEALRKRYVQLVAQTASSRNV